VSDLIINIRFWKLHFQVTEDYFVRIVKNKNWHRSWPLFKVLEFDILRGTRR
jgi:hypothetical protein